MPRAPKVHIPTHDELVHRGFQRILRDLGRLLTSEAIGAEGEDYHHKSIVIDLEEVHPVLDRKLTYQLVIAAHRVLTDVIERHRPQEAS
jgi:hypothetical protein